MRVPSQARIWLVAVLVVCAVALFTLTRLTGRAGSSQVRAAPTRSVKGAMRTIAQCVEAVASSFGISRSAMRLPPAQQSTSAIPEVRLQVSPEFSSYEFHSALVSAVAELEATVIGTEHLREKNIALQILKDGSPVMLVVLDMRTSQQQQRKESRH